MQKGIAYRSDWNKQQRMAVSGNMTPRFRNGNYRPLFVFSFNLEKMLKRNTKHCGNKEYCMSKWWKENIKYWTIFDGIWKE